MVNVMISSVNTAPLPEGAYDADCQPASVSCRDKRQRRRFPVLSLLLALLPALLFLLCGLTLRHWLLAAFALLFGICHVRVTLIHGGNL